jgi:predicted glycosyl hydrolase (DUF1957 family)
MFLWSIQRKNESSLLKLKWLYAQIFDEVIPWLILMEKLKEEEDFLTMVYVGVVWIGSLS